MARYRLGVQHPVHDDPGGGDVQPDRERPAGELAMCFEFPSDRTHEGDGDQRAEEGGQNGVGEQEGEVDRADPALPRVGGGTGVVVVRQVGNEEARRQGARGHHARAMSRAAPEADAGEPGQQEAGAIGLGSTSSIQHRKPKSKILYPA